MSNENIRYLSIKQKEQLGIIYKNKESQNMNSQNKVRILLFEEDKNRVK